MKPRVAELLEEIREREEELEELIKTHEARFIYKLEGNKIRFEQAVKQAQESLRIGIFSWLRASNPRNVLSAPIIYSMIVPFALLDLCITAYQWLCFPLYRIAKVTRSKHIVIDRHHLSYLNSIEKFNCVYCGYINGLISYAREIVARTEQYWCPIKHAHKVLDSHKRYAHFTEFGDAETYREIMAHRNGVRAQKPDA